MQNKLGFFTERQLLVLKLRAKGLSQLETAREMKTSRANVSMIESRAKRKLENARETLRAYESILTSRNVEIAIGTKLQQIPPMVLREGDRYGIHLKSNLIDIVRMAKSLNAIRDGRTTAKITFQITESGKVSVR